MDEIVKTHLTNNKFSLLRHTHFAIWRGYRAAQRSEGLDKPADTSLATDVGERNIPSCAAASQQLS